MTSSVLIALGAASLVLSACADPGGDPVAADAPLEARPPTPFEAAVTPVGMIFNVRCADPATDAFAFKVRGFFQNGLYSDASLDRVPSNDEFGDINAIISAVPSDNPDFFSVKERHGDGTAIVFALADGNVRGTGKLAGTPGSWSCEVWARDQFPGVMTPWRRAL